jgi:branched-chain amino acid transport system substrate-binding protein
LAEWGESGITIAYDTGASLDDPETEANRAARILEYEGLVGVVGHSGSRASLIGAPMYNDAEVAQLAPTSTSRRMQDAGPWTFSLAPNDSVEGTAIAQFAARELGAERVTVFFVTDEYGYGLRDGVVGELMRLGVTLLDEVPIPPRYQLLGREDVAVLTNLVLATLNRGRPDVVIMAVREISAATIIHVIHGLHPEVVFVTGDGVQISSALVDPLGSSLSQVYATLFWNPDSPDSASQDFAERYRTLHHRPPMHQEALFHDAIMLLATAVRDGGADRRAVRDYIHSLGVSREPYPGVTGPISFSAERSQPVRIIRADSLVGN